MQVSNRIQFTQDILTWVAPAIGIPGQRYFQDNKEQRNELFVRDASTYTLGALSFLGVYFGGKKLLNQIFHKETLKKTFRINFFSRKPFTVEELLAFCVYLMALTANITYAGVGAVKLSKWMSGHMAKKSNSTPSLPVEQNQPAFIWPKTQINPNIGSLPGFNANSTPAVAQQKTNQWSSSNLERMGLK